jgi:hypothetical protein
MTYFGGTESLSIQERSKYSRGSARSYRKAGVKWVIENLAGRSDSKMGKCKLD